MSTVSAADTVGRAEVCLVSMPYAAVERPPLGLGLLKSILARDGITSVVASANLWFAERTGLRLYEVCSMTAPVEFLVGEWTFAAAAFPESRELDEDYLDQVCAACRQFMYGRDGADRLRADLLALRAAATEFVDDAARRVVATGARVVGCTSTFEQHVASLALLHRVRELKPDIVTLIGGANCETVMGEATHRCFPWVDYVVSGEADGIIVQLCRQVLDQGRDVRPEELPPGVLGPGHRRQNRELRLAGNGLPRALFRDLDSLPVPSFGEYFETLAASPPLRDCIRPGLPLETSRGCWWGARHQCTFCGLNGSSMMFHSKSPDRALTEIHDLEARYGLTNFEVVDNILDMGYFNSLLPRLASEKGDRQFFYEVKANLSRKQVAALTDAGVTWVQPGIENLHSEVLRIMDKGVRGWQNIQLLKWSRESGLRLSWSVLWGFPGELDEYYVAMAEWMPLLTHLQAPQGVIRLRYDRYSVYHNEAERMGLKLLPIGAMSYVYPLEMADLDGLAYFFTVDPDRPVVSRNGGDLPDRPGVRAAIEAVKRWQVEFGRGPRAVLSMRDRDGVLDIVDSRRCAAALRHRLTGLARAVCLACDAAPRPEQLAAILHRDFGMSVSEQQAADAAAALIAERLILPIDGRLVGLAVQGTLPRLADLTQFPGGSMHYGPGGAKVRAERDMTSLLDGR